ncbi:hypothetical protein B0H14DRAFT_2629255 [Mycena olivaceomarginata]|nr:hypothetical protein B0H14DRAFT_2629255 [Mycena olivaceomarginata]
MHVSGGSRVLPHEPHSRVLQSVVSAGPLILCAEPCATKAEDSNVAHLVTPRGPGSRSWDITQGSDVLTSLCCSKYQSPGSTESASGYALMAPYRLVSSRVFRIPRAVSVAGELSRLALPVLVLRECGLSGPGSRFGCSSVAARRDQFRSASICGLIRCVARLFLTCAARDDHEYITLLSTPCVEFRAKVRTSGNILHAVPTIPPPALCWAFWDVKLPMAFLVEISMGYRPSSRYRPPRSPDATTGGEFSEFARNPRQSPSLPQIMITLCRPKSFKFTSRNFPFLPPATAPELIAVLGAFSFSSAAEQDETTSNYVKILGEGDPYLSSSLGLWTE